MLNDELGRISRRTLNAMAAAMRSMTTCGVILLCGCIHGPAALDASRVRYNEVLQRTTEEQLLLNLVRLKYRDAPFFLEVGSVSAQFQFSRSVDIEGALNEGPTRFNPDRLGLGAGIEYQERPTVTFTPLQGKDFVNALLSPLKPEVIVLLFGSGWSIDRIMRLSVHAMNGLDNASAASGPTPTREPDYRDFARASGLFRQLQRMGGLALGYETQTVNLSSPVPADQVAFRDLVDAVSKGFRVSLDETGRELVLTGSSKVLMWRIPPGLSQTGPIEEIRKLLKLNPDRSQYQIRALAGPALLVASQPAGVGGKGSSTVAKPACPVGGRTRIDISMRSLMGTLFYLSQAIEVPEAHREGGLVTITMSLDAANSFDWTEVTGDLLRVHSQRTRPANAAVAVRHRGYWFYINDTDLNSKSTFALLGQLFALQAGGVETVAPVLTLPIGG